MDPSGVSIELIASTVVATSSLPPALQKAVADLSGSVHSGADLMRHVPALAAAAQSLGVPGREKLALVQSAAHAAVDQYVSEADKAAAHGLVDGVLPSVVRAVLDVSQGHVKIEAALQAAAVEIASSPEAQAAALGLVQRCLACLLPPRPPTGSAAPAAPAPQPAAPAAEAQPAPAAEKL
jgi:hypothetical protein